MQPIHWTFNKTLKDKTRKYNELKLCKQYCTFTWYWKLGHIQKNINDDADCRQLAAKIVLRKEKNRREFATKKVTESIHKHNSL